MHKTVCMKNDEKFFILLGATLQGCKIPLLMHNFFQEILKCLRFTDTSV